MPLLGGMVVQPCVIWNPYPLFPLYSSYAEKGDYLALGWSGDDLMVGPSGLWFCPDFNLGSTCSSGRVYSFKATLGCDGLAFRMEGWYQRGDGHELEGVVCVCVTFLSNTNAKEGIRKLRQCLYRIYRLDVVSRLLAERWR